MFVVGKALSNFSVFVHPKKMSDQVEAYDMYDEFDCEVEEEVKIVEVKEEDDSETDYEVLESVDDQSADNGE